MSSGRDKEELFLEAKKEKRVKQDQLNNLAFLDKGQCLLLPTGKNAKTVQIPLPRTKTWKREDGNFYRNVWEKFGGGWMTTEEIHDYIETRCKPVRFSASMKYTEPEQNVQAPGATNMSVNTPGAATIPQLGETFQVPNDAGETIKVSETKQSEPRLIEAKPSKSKIKKAEEKEMVSDVLDFL